MANISPTLWFISYMYFRLKNTYFLKLLSVLLLLCCLENFPMTKLYIYIYISSFLFGSKLLGLFWDFLFYSIVFYLSICSDLSYVISPVSFSPLLYPIPLHSRKCLYVDFHTDLQCWFCSCTDVKDLRNETIFLMSFLY